MSKYFPEPNWSGGRVKVELNLSNYATKRDSKNTTGFDTSLFAKKTDLANSKSDVDKLDINKWKNVPSSLSSLKSKVDELNIGELETTPIDLNQLSGMVKNEVVKKTEYNAKVSGFEDKIPAVTNLDTKTTLTAKINNY